MKKITITLLVFLSVLTLTGCEPPDDLEKCLKDENCTKVVVTDTYFQGALGEEVGEEYVTTPLEYRANGEVRSFLIEQETEQELFHSHVNAYALEFMSIKSVINNYFRGTDYDYDYLFSMVLVYNNGSLRMDKNGMFIVLETDINEGYEDSIDFMLSVYNSNRYMFQNQVEITCMFKKAGTTTETVTLYHNQGKTEFAIKHYASSNWIRGIDIKSYVSSEFEEQDIEVLEIT